jgi:hypothetical protein
MDLVAKIHITNNNHGISNKRFFPQISQISADLSAPISVISGKIIN